MSSLLRVKSIVLIAMLCLLIPCGTTNAKKTDIKSFKMEDKSITLYVNQTRTLSATKKKPSKATDKIIWKSSDKKVAKVNKKGVVTGIGKGKAVITVMAKRNRYVRAKYKVKVIEFQDREISAKADYLDCSNFNDFSENSMVIIESKKDLKKYLSNLKQYNTELYNKYKNYGEEYFKDNYLVMYMEYITPYEQIVSIDSRVVQVNTGEVKLCVNIITNDTLGDKFGITVIYPYCFIQSISRAEVSGIDEIETNKLVSRQKI